MSIELKILIQFLVHELFWNYNLFKKIYLNYKKHCNYNTKKINLILHNINKK